MTTWEDSLQDSKVSDRLARLAMTVRMPTMGDPQEQASHTSTANSKPDNVDILILGAGWTSTFLIPLLDKLHVSHAATTTSGRDNTIKFKFDPSSNDLDQYKSLPRATTIVITFPLVGQGQSKTLTSNYRLVHGSSNRFIQLGSTGIFTAPHWNDSSSPYEKSNDRAIAEDELLSTLSKDACVLNLAGLYGGQRDPKNWVTRVATTKAQVRAKLAVHLVHGEDVARAILGAHEAWTSISGKRWIIADLHVYDWYDLFNAWGREARERVKDGKLSSGKGTEGKLKAISEDVATRTKESEELEYEKWVGELMIEDGIKALPRPYDKLGRILDSREFWSRVGVWPVKGRAN